MLNAYRQELTQLQEPRHCERPRQRETSGFEERTAPGPAGLQEETPPASLEEAPEESGPTLGGMTMQ